ncbi:MAG TPA: hypothetical protein VFT96_06645, partial [Gemmatimonadaceae bacterium]|nr:hypothetical protein [Gemmatimonadaceae bacterium]
VGRLADAGVDFGGFLSGLGDMLRAQLAVVLGGTAADVSEKAREHLVAGKARFAAGDLLRMLQLLGELEPRFRKSGQQQLLLETLLVRFALLDRAVALEDVLRGIGGGGGGAAGPRGGERVASPAMRAGPPSSPGDRELRASPRVEPAPRARVPADFRAPEDVPPLDDAPHPADMVDDAPARGARGSGRAGTPDVSAVTAVWDDVVAAAHSAGKSMLATALGHASPATVNGQGVLTIELDEPNDFYAQALESGRGDLLSLLGARLPGLTRVELRGSAGKATPSQQQKRISDEDIRSERLTALRKYDPVLGAAIDALDLDVVD